MGVSVHQPRNGIAARMDGGAIQRTLHEHSIPDPKMSEVPGRKHAGFNM
jgi:hypothetical protein